MSAVPGGVPPGTPLYGAYGQPLTPASAPPQQVRASYQQQPPSDYAPPMHSPTAGYPTYDDKDAGRRRTRPPEEEHGSRPPPPNFPVDDDPRRRSPISVHSNGTPPAAYPTVPSNGASPAVYHPVPSNGTPPAVYHQYQSHPYGQDRSSTPNQGSPGNHAPSQSQQPAQGPASQGQQPHLPLQAKAQPQPPPRSYSNPMSLDNLLGRDRPVNDIDQRMLGMLNRRS